MGRLIDADAIIQAVCTKLGIKDKKFLLQSEKAIVDVILNAPTIDVPTWISCEERLPNNDEEVIVSVEDDRADNIFKYTTTAWRYGDVWVSDNERICGIIAWMPLPEPWKGADDE